MSAQTEPSDAAAVQAFVSAAHREHDPFAHVHQASEEHRQTHGPQCDVYPTGSGRLLGFLARSLGAQRCLEVGCGLGYSALWLAWGSAPAGRVETVEKDAEHARLAQAHFRAEGVDGRIEIHLGQAHDVLPGLAGPFDLVFLDSDWSEYLQHLAHCLRLLRPGGLLVSSNLWPATYAPDLGGLAEVAKYRRRLLEDDRLFTTLVPGGPALSLKVSR